MLSIPAFSNADYRKLWAGVVFNQQGMSGEQVVLGLLVYQFTQSTAWVGVMLAIYFLPFFIFGILSGVIADGIDRRALLRRIEVLIAVNMILFAGVLALESAGLWVIMIFTLIMGALRAMHQPVRLSYAYDIVGGESIVAGLGLLNLGSRTGQLVGALAAGAIMDRYGGAFAFLILASGHGLAFFFFLQLRMIGKAAVKHSITFAQNFREYAGELRANRLLLMLLAVTASVEIFGFSFATALPELATTRLNIGADGLGMLHAARALGGMLAGLGLTYMGMLRHRGFAYIGVIFIFGVGLILLSVDSPFWITLAVVVLIAAMAAASDILTQSMMQLVVPNALRGRAMGVWVLAIGFGPLGHLEIGALVAMLGLGAALFFNGIALVVVGIIVLITVPRLRQL